MSLKDITLWDERKFGECLGRIKATAAQLWDDVAEASVQAILSYHEHSYSTSRAQSLYEALQEAGLGSHVNSYQTLLRRTTGITGIGSNSPWKHNGDKLRDVHDWEAALEEYASSGAALRGLTKKPKADRDQTKTKLKKISTPEKASDTFVAAATRFVDTLADLPEEEAMRIMKNATNTGEQESSNPLNGFEHPESKEAVQALVELFIKEEKTIGPLEVQSSVELCMKKVQAYLKQKLDALQEQVGNLKDVA